MWSLDKVHKVGELTAAAAVIISLIFVGLEIRDNTVASEAATYQSLASDDVHFLLNVSSSPELSRIYEAYMFHEVDNLEENEVLQAQWQLLAQLRFMENVHFQYELGMLSDDAWATRDVLLRNAALSRDSRSSSVAAGIETSAALSWTTSSKFALSRRTSNVRFWRKADV